MGEFASEGASLAKDVAGELFEGVKFVAEETLKTFQGNRQLIAVEAGPVSAVDKTLQEQYQFHWNPAANYTFTGLYYTHIRATTSGIKEEHAALGKGDADDSVDDPARPTLSGKDLETKMLDHLRAYYTKKYADRWAAKSKTDDTTGLPENHESILNKLELDLAARYESKWTRAYKKSSTTGKLPKRTKIIAADLQAAYGNDLAPFVGRPGSATKPDWAGAAAVVAEKEVNKYRARLKAGDFKKSANKKLAEQFAANKSALIESKANAKYKKIRKTHSNYDQIYQQTIRREQAAQLETDWTISSVFAYKVTYQVVEINKIDVQERWAKLRKKAAEARDQKIKLILDDMESRQKAQVGLAHDQAKLKKAAGALSADSQAFSDTFEKGKRDIIGVLAAMKADMSGKAEEVKTEYEAAMLRIKTAEKEMADKYLDRKYINRLQVTPVGAHAGVESRIHSRNTNVKVGIRLIPYPSTGNVDVRITWDEEVKGVKIADTALTADGVLSFSPDGILKSDGGKVAERFAQLAVKAEN